MRSKYCFIVHLVSTSVSTMSMYLLIRGMRPGKSSWIVKYTKCKYYNQYSIYNDLALLLSLPLVDTYQLSYFTGTITTMYLNNLIQNGHKLSFFSLSSSSNQNRPISQSSDQIWSVYVNTSPGQIWQIKDHKLEVRLTTLLIIYT